VFGCEKNLLGIDCKEFLLVELQEAKISGSSVVISSSGLAVESCEVLLVVGQGHSTSNITLARAFPKNNAKVIRIAAQVNSFISNTTLKSLEINSNLEDRVFWVVFMAIVSAIYAFFLVVALFAS
jgi:hypothetical protein